MILKASQRGGAKQLALHLLKTEENEHVEVHELRGFTGTDLQSALHEVYAVSKGTRATQFLFSLSLNPPASERVSIKEFEAAIQQVETKLGLDEQPRAVVFHEKNGRRHAHVVWSRIDTERMKAINLSHFKLKLRDVSRELYLEHGWAMPRGLASSRERDPKNFTRDEWEQARRGDHDPRALKALFRECWLVSDSKAAFAQALKGRGYTLARGDRRGHVAVDFRGEVYAIAKWAGLRTKDVRDRLGDGKDLPSVEQARAANASRMTDILRRHVAESEAAFRKKAEALAEKRAVIVERQRRERAELDKRQQERRARESAERGARLNKGFRGIWDRLTGAYGKTARRNELEAWDAAKRDRRERDVLIEAHLDERQGFHQLVREAKAAHGKEVAQLHRDIAGYMATSANELPDARGHFREAASHQRDGNDRGRGRERERDFGPEL
jgi:Relaxase/Mobilisation nuclease domain